MGYSVFIDGSEGTTGLKIRERLAGRSDIEIISIEEDQRKDLNVRLTKLQEADITFLCLPDEASLELVRAAQGAGRILDASTAHRTHQDWIYGLPELTATQRDQISNANRVSVPGCHATGFILMVRPLIEQGIVAKDYPFTCHSITGYSGGGKNMILAYEATQRADELSSPRQYALAQHHKHLPEMTMWAGLEHAPIFTPIVADFYSGMLVTVPLSGRLLQKQMTASQLWQLFADRYRDQPMIDVMPFEQEPTQGFLAANQLADSNRLQIFIFGQMDQIVLAARFDNLGKGASGAAIQCMNLMLQLPETTGL